MTVVFITGHDYDAGRKVDFHFWSDYLERNHVKSFFITVGLSQMTRFKKNARYFSKPCNRWVRVSPYISKYVWKPLFHPVNLGIGWINRITTPLFELYPKQLPKNIIKEISDASIFVIENGAGLMLVQAFRSVFPQAKFIYTVSDRMQTVNMHPALKTAEKNSLDFFDLIRVPSFIMAKDYSAHRNVRYIAPGIDKNLFDRDMPSPYFTQKNAVSVGDMLFDEHFIGLAAEHFPDWNFHLFGRKAVLTEKRLNVIEHGEQAFADIVPYIKHADIGLAPYLPAADVEYISQSSLKIMQYMYCGYSIVAPYFADNGSGRIIPYIPFDQESIVSAFKKAENAPKIIEKDNFISSWDEVAEKIFSSAGGI